MVATATLTARGLPIISPSHGAVSVTSSHQRQAAQVVLTTTVSLTSSAHHHLISLLTANTPSHGLTAGGIQVAWSVSHVAVTHISTSSTVHGHLTTLTTSLVRRMLQHSLTAATSSLHPSAFLQVRTSYSTRTMVAPMPASSITALVLLLI